MEEFYSLLINGGLAMLLLEGIKLGYRFFFKKPEFDFPPLFYGVSIPTLNVLVIPLLALLEIPGTTMPTDWLGWVRSAVVVAVGSLVSLLFYSGGLQKLKEYNKEYRLKKD